MMLRKWLYSYDAWLALVLVLAVLALFCFLTSGCAPSLPHSALPPDAGTTAPTTPDKPGVVMGQAQDWLFYAAFAWLALGMLLAVGSWFFAPDKRWVAWFGAAGGVGFGALLVVATFIKFWMYTFLCLAIVAGVAGLAWLIWKLYAKARIAERLIGGIEKAKQGVMLDFARKETKSILDKALGKTGKALVDKLQGRILK